MFIIKSKVNVYWVKNKIRGPHSYDAEGGTGLRNGPVRALKDNFNTSEMNIGVEKF